MRTADADTDRSLAAARAALAAHRHNLGVPGEGEELRVLGGLADAFEALDGLLSRGATPPVAWNVEPSSASQAAVGTPGVVVLAHGSPFDGISLVGPVSPNDPDLEEFTDRHLRGQDWWYVHLDPLAHVRDKAGLGPDLRRLGPDGVLLAREMAESAYHAEARRLAEAIRDWVGETVRQEHPTAAALHVVGEWAEEHLFRVRAERLCDADGAVLADCVGVDEGSWDSIRDEIEPHLDWMGELDSPDVWIGMHTIEVGGPAATAGS